MRCARAWLLCVTPRRLGFALCILGFFWAITMMNLSLVSRQDDDSSPDELRVSKRYLLNWHCLCHCVIDSQAKHRFDTILHLN